MSWGNVQMISGMYCLDSKSKQLINEKMNHVLKEWNTSFKNNRGENIKQELKNEYYDLVDINTKLASMKLRKF